MKTNIKIFTVLALALTTMPVLGDAITREIRQNVRQDVRENKNIAKTINDSAKKLKIGDIVNYGRDAKGSESFDTAVSNWKQKCLSLSDEITKTDVESSGNEMRCIVKSCEKRGWHVSDDKTKCEKRPTITTGEVGPDNNCLAEGGTWENNTCKCPSAQVWDSEHQVCTQPTTSEEEKQCTNNGGYWENNTCKCRGLMKWSERAKQCVDQEDTALIEFENKFKGEVKQLTDAFERRAQELTNECNGSIKDGKCEPKAAE